MAVSHPEFAQLGAEVLTISVDSLYDHQVWNEAELAKMVPGGAPFPMISDRSGAIGKRYGVYDQTNGKTFRSTFLIDPDGTVVAAEAISGPVGRSTEEVLRLLQAHQELYRSGRAVPCNWQEGQDTLDQALTNCGQTWQHWRPGLYSEDAIPENVR